MRVWKHLPSIALLTAGVALASKPIRTLDDFVPCFRAAVDEINGKHLKAAKPDARARAEDIVKMARFLTKHLKEQRAAAEQAGDSATVKKIDGIRDQLEKEPALVEARRLIKASPEDVDWDRVPLSGQPSLTTGRTDRVSGGSAVSRQ